MKVLVISVTDGKKYFEIDMKIFYIKGNNKERVV